VRELSQHLLDLLENSIQAGARRVKLEIAESTTQNRLWFRISDDGRGMDAETLRRVTDPFFTTRTTRHVGLGLPLLQEAARRCQGDLTIASHPGVGTTVEVWFRRDHIDRAPLGDIQTTLMSALLLNQAGDAPQQFDLTYRHVMDEREFAFDTAEMRDMLGDVPLSHPAVREWVEGYIQEGLESLQRGDEWSRYPVA
jgi:hypothetical protein